MTSFIAQAMSMLWTALSTATDYLGRIVNACGMPFGLFITLITALFVIDIIFVSYRYRTIGEVMGDRAEKFSSTPTESVAMKHANSSANSVIYAKLRERGKR